MSETQPPSVASLLVGVDVGGTFTDVVTADKTTGEIRIFKTPTTPENQADGILAGIAGLADDLTKIQRISHGTTVATNTLLEGNGAKVALLTTDGFRDVLEIGRCRRNIPDSIFNTHFIRPKPLIPRWLRFEVSERIRASGEVLRPLLEEEVLRIADQIRDERVEAVAICFLHAYRNDRHEREAKALLKKALPDVFICTSSEILPEIREYERFSTTSLNAFIAPVMHRYIGRLMSSLRASSYKAELYTMASQGGIMSSETVVAYPIHTVLSGPAAGVNGAIFLAEQVGLRNLITYDMGGTSTDICLIENLQPLLSSDFVFAGMPISKPQIDMHTVGAGGGSIAWVDIDGALKVGPRSAGAIPGPACYDRGGTAVTITDANVILGRLGESLLDGQLPLNRQNSEKAIAGLASELGGNPDPVWLADGVIRLGVAAMAGAIRTISIERGHDPRDFVLVAMGGAGPMHAALVAEELGIREVLLPHFPGNISALGLLAADLRHDFVRTIMRRAADADISEIESICEELASTGREMLNDEGVAADRVDVTGFADMRFAGQAYELSVPLPTPLAIGPLIASFIAAYKRRYGHEQEEPVEIVNLRVVCTGRTDRPVLPKTRSHRPEGVEPVIGRSYFKREWHATPIVRREWLAAGERLDGPVIIQELGATSVVPPGWQVHCQDNGAIIIRHN